jgi:putative addiction module component (TIGR02574 family)
MTHNPLLSAALALPPKARVALADSLYDSLEQVDESIEAAWVKEAEARIDAYHRGEQKTYSAEIVLSEFLG